MTVSFNAISARLVTTTLLDVIENAAAGTVSFAVRIQPRARNNEIVGELDGAIKIRLQAPALEGRANEALIEFLARLLKTPNAAVRIQSGERSRIKRVEIRGVTKQHIEQLIVQDA
jgi:uncharacterized protein (TIGR00251 family)